MGKSSPKPPNYQPVADASAQAAQIGAQLGYAQLGENARQYDGTMAFVRPIADAQRGMMDATRQQGDDYYNYLKSTYRPLEQRIVADANRFNTAAYRNELANTAAADLGRAQANTRAQRERAQRSMGVNPNSRRFWGGNEGVQEAAARGAAMNTTRQQARDMGYARSMDAAGLGRNLPGASTGAYATALNAGNSAAGNFASPGQNYLTGMAQGIGTIQAGQNAQLQGLSGLMNTQASIYNQASANNAQIWSAALTGLGTAAGRVSDRRLKQDIEQVGAYPNGLPMYEFAYIDDPDVRWRGVMADDVEEIIPEAVLIGPDGYKRVDYALLGLTMERV